MTPIWIWFVWGSAIIVAVETRLTYLKMESTIHFPARKLHSLAIGWSDVSLMIAVVNMFQYPYLWFLPVLMILAMAGMFLAVKASLKNDPDAQRSRFVEHIVDTAKPVTPDPNKVPSSGEPDKNDGTKKTTL